MNPLRYLLFPFSLLYGIATGIRNKLFDHGKLTSVKFTTPVIVVGNLNTGGTGKTPHTEYLVRLLHPRLKIAVLSRGYGRKTTGYLMANHHSTAEDIGDEPLQIFSKFTSLILAVCEKRVMGIHRLLEQYPSLSAIVLDDAFQHRYVEPGKAIMITSYSGLFYKDHILPMGNLRENRTGADRADVIIVSKCPDSLSIEEANSIRRSIHTYAKAPVFFTTLKYGALKACENRPTIELSEGLEIALLTGIANPSPLLEYLEQLGVKVIKHFQFRDHYSFQEKDYDHLLQYQKTHPNIPLITTEKDFVRISNPKKRILNSGKGLYYLPIQVSFLLSEGDKFNNLILDYVE